MDSKDTLRCINQMLDQARQKLIEGELAVAFELVEDIRITIENEKLKYDLALKSVKEQSSFIQLVEVYSSLRRKLLKELARNL